VFALLEVVELRVLSNLIVPAMATALIVRERMDVHHIVMVRVHKIRIVVEISTAVDHVLMEFANQANAGQRANLETIIHVVLQVVLSVIQQLLLLTLALSVYLVALPVK